MKKVEEYLKRAAQCRKLATRGDASVRQQLNGMADTWEQLAIDRKTQLERQTRIALLEAMAHGDRNE